MPTQSRTYNSLRNSAAATVIFLINFCLQFISRKIFLDYLGTEILGLNTTATNLLQFLNLAELGISSAVGFTLYKPIHDDDRRTINEIVTLQRHLYRRIALLVLGGATVLMAFFPVIFAKMQLPLWYAYGSFGVLLFSALLGYFVNYKQIVLTAAQLDYKVQLFYKSVLMVKLLTQILAVRFLADGYVWWLALEVLFAVLASWSLHRATMKACPYLEVVDKSFKQLCACYSVFTTKIKQMFFHRVGGFALQQCSPLVIYAYSSLTLVALYGNYYMVIIGILSLMNATFNSMGASIGNLVAEGNKQRIVDVFWELFSARFWIVTTLCFCAYSLIPAFIRLWIGEQYLLPTSTLSLLIAMLYIQLFRTNVGNFLDAYALTRDIWSPIIEASLNIGGSILLGYYWGLNGILLAVVASLSIMIEGWKPIFLFREGLRLPFILYIRQYATHLPVGILCFAVSLPIVGRLPLTQAAADSWMNFLLAGIVHLLLFASISMALMAMLFKSYRRFLQRLKRILGNVL